MKSKKLKEKDNEKEKRGGFSLWKNPVVIILVLIVSLGAVFYLINMGMSGSGRKQNAEQNEITQRMQEAYASEDWETLHEIVIDECETATQSSYYFTYRTAWYLATYVPEFDAANENGDKQRMEEIYTIIQEDYNRRDSLYHRMYDSVPEIEDALVLEYERETQILGK